MPNLIAYNKLEILDHPMKGRMMRNLMFWFSLALICRESWWQIEIRCRLPCRHTLTYWTSHSSKPPWISGSWLSILLSPRGGLKFLRVKLILIRACVKCVFFDRQTGDFALSWPKRGSCECFDNVQLIVWSWPYCWIVVKWPLWINKINEFLNVFETKNIVHHFIRCRQSLRKAVIKYFEVRISAAARIRLHKHALS